MLPTVLLYAFFCLIALGALLRYIKLLNDDTKRRVAARRSTYIKK